MSKPDKENKRMLNMLSSRYVNDSRNPNRIKLNDQVVFKKWGKEHVGTVQSLGEEFGQVEELTADTLWNAQIMALVLGTVPTPKYESYSESKTLPDAPQEHSLGREAMWKPYRYMVNQHQRRTGRLIAVVRTKTGNYKKVYIEDCHPFEQ